MTSPPFLRKHCIVRRRFSSMRNGRILWSFPGSPGGFLWDRFFLRDLLRLIEGGRKPMNHGINMDKLYLWKMMSTWISSYISSIHSMLTQFCMVFLGWKSQNCGGFSLILSDTWPADLLEVQSRERRHQLRPGCHREVTWKKPIYKSRRSYEIWQHQYQKYIEIS